MTILSKASSFTTAGVAFSVQSNHRSTATAGSHPVILWNTRHSSGDDNSPCARNNRRMLLFLPGFVATSWDDFIPVGLVWIRDDHGVMDRAAAKRTRAREARRPMPDKTSDPAAVGHHRMADSSPILRRDAPLPTGGTPARCNRMKGDWGQADSCRAARAGRRPPQQKNPVSMHAGLAAATTPPAPGSDHRTHFPARPLRFRRSSRMRSTRTCLRRIAPALRGNESRNSGLC